MHTEITKQDIIIEVKKICNPEYVHIDISQEKMVNIYVYVRSRVLSRDLLKDMEEVIDNNMYHKGVMGYNYKTHFFLTSYLNSHDIRMIKEALSDGEMLKYMRKLDKKLTLHNTLQIIIGVILSVAIFATVVTLLRTFGII